MTQFRRAKGVRGQRPRTQMECVAPRENYFLETFLGENWLACCFVLNCTELSLMQPLGLLSIGEKMYSVSFDSPRLASAFFSGPSLPLSLNVEAESQTSPAKYSGCAMSYNGLLASFCYGTSKRPNQDFCLRSCNRQFPGSTTFFLLTATCGTFWA